MLLSDEREFQQAMRDYTDHLIRISYMYVKDWQVAEDIVQDVFLIYYTKYEQFEARASLKTYLTRMTINKCKDYLKSWRYRTQQLTNKFTNSKKDEQFLLKSEERQQIAVAVLKLAVPLREVIIHYYYDELSVLEVAELLQISDNTVKTRLRRARQLLKEQLTHEQWEVLSHE